MTNGHYVSASISLPYSDLTIMADAKTSDLILDYRLVPAEDVVKAFNIEDAEYPESEAASLENLIYRQAVAPLLFLGCYTQSPATSDAGEQKLKQDDETGGDKLVGYIVSTQSSDKSLTHSSMSTHDPRGTSVCIHSVCVAGAYQRRGIARAMLKEYLKHLHLLNASATLLPPSSSEDSTAKGSPFYFERVLLIAHKELIDLYSGAGFELVGKSEVEHGPDPWYEMVYRLR